MINEYMLIPYHLRERLSDALFMSDMCCDDLRNIVASAPMHSIPAHDGKVVAQVWTDLVNDEIVGGVTLNVPLSELEHGTKLYALKAAPEIAGAKIIEALRDAEEIMHAYFFPVNWCIDCGAHVDGFHETGCIAGSILDKHRKIISDLEAK